MKKIQNHKRRPSGFVGRSPVLDRFSGLEQYLEIVPEIIRYQIIGVIVIRQGVEDIVL